MQKQQKAAPVGRLALFIAVGRLSLLIIKQVKLISDHRARSCISPNCSNLKWFLSRWKFLAAAVIRKRKWLGAMIFDKNATSYCRELCSPTLLPADASPFARGRSQIPRAGEMLHCPGTWKGKA